MLAASAVDTVALGPDWLDPTNVVETFGAYAFLAVVLVIFAECGLLIGFFLPGDSLLFMTGVFIASGSIDTPLWVACLALAISAVIGNLVGYAIGWRAGPAIFDKPESRVFKPKHVAKTHEFFEKYGVKAIFLARFVPIVRTFITVMAGVGRMDTRSYVAVSTVGGIVWAAGITALGFALGDIAFIREHIEAAIILIVVVSVIPMVVEAYRARRKVSAELP
ncbi:DedA family protein [Motilibacter aurantiacus]|uniref:DedA family protein n=1 Tax=Motilibacter aurantiacus TaxID=2714955 RepID=UPI00140B8FB9|nr:DedA family protein [Motilibacter aurantiacus]